ncbi:MAG: HNH endonuclease [Leptospiraceae bacterium]|nr:HNH endonuclease [Leptospiraceae bacterium]
MKINYRAVHSNLKYKWRKVGSHKSIKNAIEGKNGAKALLSKKNRFKKIWDICGEPSYVFVWEENSLSGYLLRRNPEKKDNIQMVKSSKYEILNFEKNGGCEIFDLDSYFDKLLKEHGEELFEPAKQLYPDEIDNEDITKLFEGAKTKVIVNKYERDSKARQQCIEKFGYKCQVCEKTLEEVYGKLGTNFIHVHHLKPLAEIGKEYSINPINDLRPVCPNCHAMLHNETPVLTIEKLREIIKKHNKY